jgi:hypothetical protein
MSPLRSSSTKTVSGPGPQRHEGQQSGREALKFSFDFSLLGLSSGRDDIATTLIYGTREDKSEADGPITKVILWPGS